MGYTAPEIARITVLELHLELGVRQGSQNKCLRGLVCVCVRDRSEQSE